MQSVQELIAQIKEVITNKTTPEKNELVTQLKSLTKDKCFEACQLYTQEIALLLEAENNAEIKCAQELDEIESQVVIDSLFLDIYLHKIKLYQYLELSLREYLEKDKISFETDDEQQTEYINDQLLETLEKHADCFFDLSELLIVSNVPRLRNQLLETTLLQYKSLIELIEQKQRENNNNTAKYFNKIYELNFAILMILSLLKDKEHAEQLLQHAAQIFHFFNKFPQILTTLKKAEVESYRFIALDLLGKNDEAMQSCSQFITLYEYCWNNSIEIDNLKEDYLNAQRFLFNRLRHQSNNIRAVTHADKFIELYDNIDEDKWSDTSNDSARQQWQDYLEAHKFRCSQYITLYEKQPNDDNYFKALRACNDLYTLFDELINEEDKSSLSKWVREATRFKSKYHRKELTADLPKGTQDKLTSDKRKASAKTSAADEANQSANIKRQKPDDESQKSDNDEINELRLAFHRKKERHKKLASDFARAQPTHSTENENYLKRISELEKRLSKEVTEHATTKMNYEAQMKKLSEELSRVRENLGIIEQALEERQGIIDDLNQQMQTNKEEYEKRKQAWKLQKMTLTEERDTSQVQYLAEKPHLEKQIAELRNQLSAANAKSARLEVTIRTLKNPTTGRKPWTPTQFQQRPPQPPANSLITTQIQSGVTPPPSRGASSKGDS